MLDLTAAKLQVQANKEELDALRQEAEALSNQLDKAEKRYSAVANYYSSLENDMGKFAAKQKLSDLLDAKRIDEAATAKSLISEGEAELRSSKVFSEGRKTKLGKEVRKVEILAGRHERRVAELDESAKTMAALETKKTAVIDELNNSAARLKKLRDTHSASLQNLVILKILSKLILLRNIMA